MAYTVYIHTNKRNGKKYVGITSKKPAQRWNSGYGYYLNKPFYHAIKKYGWNDGFKHDIVAEGLTAEQAASLERELIAQYDSNDPQHGYNRTGGGFGYDGVLSGHSRTPKLPPYRVVMSCAVGRKLFAQLLAVAYGGQKLKEEKRIYCNGILVRTETKENVTAPNIMAIDVILKNYENEPALRANVAALKALRESIDDIGG